MTQIAFSTLVILFTITDRLTSADITLTKVLPLLNEYSQIESIRSLIVLHKPDEDFNVKDFIDWFNTTNVDMEKYSMTISFLDETEFQLSDYINQSQIGFIFVGQPSISLLNTLSGTVTALYNNCLTKVFTPR